MQGKSVLAWPVRVRYAVTLLIADYAHPRFLAQMLRMGDLLDADNNRFNASNEIVFGEIPESSRNHWKKHMSARHILIAPDIIEYRADCSKPEVYRETRNFLSWLKTEVEFTLALEFTFSSQHFILDYSRQSRE